MSAVRTPIAELRAGATVEGVFACTRKDRLATRNGAPYLALELRDRTGALNARAFRDVDLIGGRFERGDLIWVSGRVERFRDELQLEVLAARRADEGQADPAEFLPVAYRDVDELEGFLEHLGREVHDREYRALVDAFMADEALREAFRRAPCTRGGHHSYLGGLLEHTVAVATLALELAPLHPRLNPDLLLSAAILHDIGKVHEFELGAEIAYSEQGRLLGHLTLGDRIVTDLARRARLPEPKAAAVSHCVLAHHGPEGVAGKRFASAEALALQRLNALDAGVKGALEHGLRA